MPTPRRRLIARCALLGAMLTTVLVLPAYASAAPSAARVEERAARAQERTARRSAQRASRAHEREAREARRAARTQERAARRARRGEGTVDSGEVEAPSPAGVSNEAPKTLTAGGESGKQNSQQAGASSDAACHLSAEARAPQIIVGETAAIVGRLQCANDLGAAERTLTIYQRQRGSAPSVAGTATTAADGSYEFISAVLTTNSTFSVRASQRLHARVVVEVAPAVSLAGPPAGAQLASASRGGRSHLRSKETFTGAVSPTFDGARVTLQIGYLAAGGKWNVAAYGRVDAQGSFSFAHAFKIPGEVSVRAVVHGGRLNAAAISETLTYDVAQPQNPELTIETSADPLQYEQGATISGVAAAGANQTVVLLAQTHGSAFTAVAHATTDGSGHYTFAEVPLTSTFYRVGAGTETSTTLLESVRFALTPAPAPAEVQAGEAQTLSGHLNPAHVGQAVYLEREYRFGHGFYIVARGAVESDLQYRIQYAFTRHGANVMRITAPGDGSIQGATSEPFTVTAAP